MAHPVDVGEYYPDDKKQVIKGDHIPNTGDLSIYVEERRESGVIVLWSRWELTEEEADLVSRTREIWLGYVNPPAIPPATITAFKPPLP